MMSTELRLDALSSPHTVLASDDVDREAGLAIAKLLIFTAARRVWVGGASNP